MSAAPRRRPPPHACQVLWSAGHSPLADIDRSSTGTALKNRIRSRETSTFPRHTRRLALLAGLGTIALALALRVALTGIRGPRSAAEAATFRGWFSKYAGVTLSATVVYFVARLLAPRLRPGRAALLAAAFCLCVEFLQLTPWPRFLSRQHVLLRLVFGEYYGTGDLPCYVLGVLLGLWMERRCTPHPSPADSDPRT